MRGNRRTWRSPRFSAAAFDRTSVVMTSTGYLAATSAVASVHPLHTTTTSNSPGCASESNASRQVAIVPSSLWAGMTTAVIWSTGSRSLQRLGRDDDVVVEHGLVAG